MPKVTFSLDDDVVRLLRSTAERARKPQSVVVREAIAQYAARDEKLTDAERESMLQVLLDIRARPATRTTAAVERELREIRRSRRTGWSRPTT